MKTMRLIRTILLFPIMFPLVVALGLGRILLRRWSVLSRLTFVLALVGSFLICIPYWESLATTIHYSLVYACLFTFSFEIWKKACRL